MVHGYESVYIGRKSEDDKSVCVLSILSGILWKVDIIILSKLSLGTEKQKSALNQNKV